MGQAGAAVSAGLIVGPALGGLLSARGGAPLLGGVAAAFSGLGLAAVALLVPASPPRTEPKEAEVGRFRLLSAGRALRVLFGVAVVGWFALACLEGTFGRLIERNLGQGALAFGAIFGYESLVSVGVQSLLVARLQARWGDRRLLVAAFALQGAGLAAMPFARSFGPLLAAATVFAVGNALVNPSINGWCSRETPEAEARPPSSGRSNPRAPWASWSGRRSAAPCSTFAPGRPTWSRAGCPWSLRGSSRRRTIRVQVDGSCDRNPCPLLSTSLGATGAGRWLVRPQPVLQKATGHGFRARTSLHPWHP